jgi:hypothetical protein
MITNMTTPVMHEAKQSYTNGDKNTLIAVFYSACHVFTGRWFSPGTTVSSTNETDRHEITEILLNVALNAITQVLTKGKQNFSYFVSVSFITLSHNVVS